MAAKNYCNEEELAALNSVVFAYLEFAEMQARRRIAMYKKDFIAALETVEKVITGNKTDENTRTGIIIL